MIDTDPPGEWAVDNNLTHVWRIVNKRTGRTKVIGKVMAGRNNWFDRAMEEATRRNELIRKKKEQADARNPD